MSGRSRKLIIILTAVLAGIGVLKLADWTAAYLWFGALDYTNVFWRVLGLKFLFMLLAFSAAFAFFWINLKILALSGDLDAMITALASQSHLHTPGSVPPGTRDVLQNGAGGSGRGMQILVAAALFAPVIGFAFYVQWDTLLRFWWAQPYGETDPVFGRDIGFYLFKLPFYELIQNWVLWTSLMTSMLLVLIYRYTGRLPHDLRRLFEAPPDVLRHLAANIGLYVLALAWGFYLDRFDLLQSTRGAVHGAGYTDVYATLPALWVMLGTTLAVLPILFAAVRRRNLRLFGLSLAGYAGVFVLAVAVIPAMVQAYRVEPNELALETPFLKHNIALTRKAYRLDDVDERSYDAHRELTATAISNNPETIDNIRVWDWEPLSDTFRQLQQIRTYYEFGDVDVDRYRFGGAYRQVMLAARELSNTLPGKAETWVNRHLQYTHGYGLAMSLAAQKNADGNPVLVVKDLPPRSAEGLAVEQPAIYYGENMSGHRIVATGIREFDFPRGDRNVYAHYAGSGGVGLDSFWKRLLFAWHQFDVNITISSYITGGSRIQLWRNVRERVGRIAPFLSLDADPYLVLSEGRLFWIQDAYTISSLFPYSEPHEGYNYIRNSVKAVVDAYEGDVAFYVMDPDDPVLAVYRAALPDLFRNLDEMPEDLRRHLRYPQDLFRAQVAKYNTYHVTLPQVFYNGEDQWNVPKEKYGGVVIDMKAYYVLTKLPGEDRLQFLLMTPLTPANRPNMIAWMGARSDFPDYGQLLVYKLPKERLIHGPIQVEAEIDQDTLISQQLSLWDQRGSRVIRGNLLVIPIDEAFLYVEPVYLLAEDSAIPQLKRVIVSDGERIAMLETLRQSLNAVLGVEPEAPAATPAAGEAADLAEARAALAAAEQALRDGDWARFGAAMERLKRLLGE